MVDPNRPFLVEEDYVWKVLSETDAMGICRRIVGMVAPHDTDKFEAPLYNVQAQWESLRAFPVNTGQLLDRTMELKGRKACDVLNNFVEKIDMQSSDFSDPKVSATTKARGAQVSVSAFGGASGGRSSRSESRMRDIFGVGHMRGGHNQTSQGPEARGASWRDKQNSRKRGGYLSRYEVREQRPKLDAMVGRVFYPPSIDAREGRNSFRPHQHIADTARTQATADNYLSTKAVEERG